MTTINDIADLDEKIEAWAETEPAHRRAAAWALVEHRHWINDATFSRECIVLEDEADEDEEPTVFLCWWKAAHMLRDGEFTGSPSEIAMLKFCVDMAIDGNGWQSLDTENRSILLNAARIALTY